MTIPDRADGERRSTVAALTGGCDMVTGAFLAEAPAAGGIEPLPPTGQLGIERASPSGRAVRSIEASVSRLSEPVLILPKTERTYRLLGRSLPTRAAQALSLSISVLLACGSFPILAAPFPCHSLFRHLCLLPPS